jgi:hypothetical protein
METSELKKCNDWTEQQDRNVKLEQNQTGDTTVGSTQSEDKGKKQTEKEQSSKALRACNKRATICHCWGSGRKGEGEQGLKKNVFQ